MGKINLSETRLKTLEVLWITALQSMSADDRDRFLAEAFSRAMPENNSLEICGKIADLGLAIEKEGVAPINDPGHRQDYQYDE